MLSKWRSRPRSNLHMAAGRRRWALTGHFETFDVRIWSHQSCRSSKSRSVCIIHTMQSRELIKLLQADGWQLKRTRGSHHQFAHPTKPGTVTVPHPKKDLGKGLVQAIRKQAGLK